MLRDQFSRIVLICLLPLLLFACTSSEEKAQVEYTRIVAIEQAGDVDQALVLYAALAQNYARTAAGQLATQAHERIVQRREAELRLEMSKQVERFRLALEGYGSMYGKLPTSVQELDGSGYFFDSKYLGEIVPAGYTTYLLLDGSANIRIWPLRGDKEVCWVGGMSGDLQRSDKAQVAKEIAEGYREVERLGNLVVVAHK